MQSVKPFNIEKMPHMFKNMLIVQWEFAPFLTKHAKKVNIVLITGGKRLS